MGSGAARAQPGTVDPHPPPSGTSVPEQRFGIEAIAGGGSFLFLGGSVRYEHRVTARSAVTGRFTGLLGGQLMSTAPAFRLAGGHVGIRHYSGGVYVAAEGGAVVVHSPGYEAEDGYLSGMIIVRPSTILMLGGKTSRVDYGVWAQLIWTDAAIIGVHLGFDLFNR